MMLMFAGTHGIDRVSLRRLIDGLLLLLLFAC